MEGIIFKFYLNFKNDNTGLIEITEVVKFDGASFTVEQDKGRYGRDVSFGNEEVNLVFYEGLYDTTVNPLQLPDASIVYNLTMGLPFLLDYYKTFGFESEVEFIIEKDGLTFTVGVLDFQLAKTDLLTYFETKIIQETKRATINRRKDTKVDVFSALDLDMNPIAPLVPVNVLLKAKPVKQISEWEAVSGFLNVARQSTFNGTDIPFFNKIKNVTKYGVGDTLSWLIDTNVLVTDFDEWNQIREDFKISRANEEFNNIKVKIKLRLRLEQFIRDDDFNNDRFVFRGHLVKGNTGTFQSNWSGFPVVTTPPYATDTANSITFMQKFLGDDFGVYEIDVNEDIEIDFGNLDENGKIWLNFSFNGTTEHSVYRIDFLDSSVELVTEAVSIDSVIKGVRYIDVIKQNVLSISGMPVIAPRFDVNGEHYEQFAFNGYGIRQIPRGFYVTFDQLMKDTQEINGDYQIKPNDVFLGEYPDFYPNNELAVFLQPADDEFTSQFNERYTLVNGEFKYTKQENNKDESNTLGAVHTETQYLFPNRLVENVKKITVDYVRSAELIESARKQGILAKGDTSLSIDDDMFLIDAVPMVDGVGTFTRTLLQRINPITGFIEILNSDGEHSGTFNWTLLGFEVGDSFKILTGSNIGWYTVQSISQSVITIGGGGGSFSGTESITVKYPYTNVDYVNRTIEGFISIVNLDGGDNYSNLRYSIRRNIKHWESYFATASKYKPLGTIQNTFFKNEDEDNPVTSQFTGQPVYVESENILVSSLEPAILSPLIYKTRVIVTFEEMVTLLEGLNTVNMDGSIGGFIRVVDTNDRVIKLHPTILDYEWSTQLLSITGEERNESDFVTVNTFGTSLVEINEVGYNTILFSNEWYKINGNYVTLFDANAIPLINPTRIEKVKVNGISYSTGTDLAIALSNL